MAGFPLPTPIFQALDDSGVAVSGALLYTYSAGTSTPKATFSDQGLTTPNANPVVCDSAGRAQVWIGDGQSYKFILKTSGGVTIWTVDNISVPSVPTPTPVTDLTGVIKMYGGSAAPVGYLLCDGSAISRSTYSDLFAILGTSFGVGNGSTTFNLPDLRQRVPLGKAASGTGSTIGSTGGTIDHVHSGPAHTHDPGTYAIPSGGAHTHTTGAPSATADLQFGSGEDAASPTHTHDIASSGAHVHTLTGATGSSGTGSTGTANPPFQVVQFIVKT